MRESTQDLTRLEQHAKGSLAGVANAFDLPTPHIRTMTSEMGRAKTQSTDLTQTLVKSNSAAGGLTAGFKGIVAGAAAIGIVIPSLVGGLSQVSDEMVRITSEATRMSMGTESAVAFIGTLKPEIDDTRLMAQLRDISTRIPQSVAALSEGLYNIFSTLDIDQNQGVALLEKLSKASVPARTDPKLFTAAILGEMKAYKLGLEDVDHITDVFFQTVNSGVISSEELARELGGLGQNAKRAGVDIDLLGGMIVAVTQQGGSAAENATNLANALQHFVRPEVQKSLHDLGIETTDASGNFRDFRDILADIDQRMTGLSESAREAELFKIFPDVQASKGLGVLLDQQEILNKTYKTNIELAGQAEAASVRVMDTTEKRLALLKNQMDATNSAAADRLLPTLERLAPSFTGINTGVVQLTSDLANLLAPQLERGNKLFSDLQQIGDFFNLYGQRAGTGYKGLTDLHDRAFDAMAANEARNAQKSVEIATQLQLDLERIKASEDHSYDAIEDMRRNRGPVEGVTLAERAANIYKTEQDYIQRYGTDPNTGLKAISDADKEKARLAKEAAAEAKHTRSAIEEAVSQTKAMSSAVTEWIDAAMAVSTFQRPSNLRPQLDVIVADVDYSMMAFQKVALRYAITDKDGKTKSLDFLTEWLSAARSGMGVISETVTAYKSIEDMIRPSRQTIDGILADTDYVFAKQKAAAEKYSIESMAITQMYAQTNQSVFSSLSTVANFTGQIAGQRQDVRGQINLLFTNADHALRLFTVMSATWKEENMERAARIGKNVGEVFGGINAGFQAVLSAQGASLIADYEIDDAMTNMEHILGRALRLMDSPVFQGDFQKKAAAWSSSVGGIFNTLKSGMELSSMMGENAGNQSAYDFAMEPIKVMGDLGLGSGGAGGMGGSGNTYNNCLIVDGDVVATNPDIARIIAGIKGDQSMRHGPPVGQMAGAF